MTVKKAVAYIRAASQNTQKEFVQLHQMLAAKYEQLLMESVLAQHPGWSVVTGDTAWMIYMFRNWAFSLNCEENACQMKALASDLDENYFDADIPMTVSEANAAMLAAERVYEFSKRVLNNRHMLVFLFPARHKFEDSFCRCYEASKSVVFADVYLLHPHKDEAASPQSILFHELGHVVNLMLTGDVNILPEDFKVVTALLKLNLAGVDTKEFFAHCFAMSLLIEPMFQHVDPFSAVPDKHKQIFRTYFNVKFLNSCLI